MSPCSRLCGWCQVAFTTTRAAARFCSQRCVGKWRTGRPRDVLYPAPPPPPRPEAEIRAEAGAMLTEQLAVQRKRWAYSAAELLRADARPSKSLRSYAPTRVARKLRRRAAPVDSVRQMLKKLAAEHHLPLSTLLSRWHMGRRGERLVGHGGLRR